MDGLCDMGDRCLYAHDFNPCAEGGGSAAGKASSPSFWKPSMREDQPNPTSIAHDDLRNGPNRLP